MKHIFPILIGIAVLIMFSIFIEASLGGTSQVYKVDAPTLTLR